MDGSRHEDRPRCGEGKVAVRQTSFAGMACSLARSLELIGDWWTPLIIRDLQLGVDRFDALAEDLGISRNLLTARLAHLVGHGIVDRQRYQEHPPRDRYVLTEAGRALMPVLLALIAWGDRWATPEGGPPLVFRHRRCGHRFTPTVACDVCGQPFAWGDVEPLPGPGLRRGPGTRLLGQVITGSGSAKPGAPGTASPTQ
jgi:DNA-binding HxlR family transcriptional regulator